MLMPNDRPDVCFGKTMRESYQEFRRSSQVREGTDSSVQSHVVPSATPSNAFFLLYLTLLYLVLSNCSRCSKEKVNNQPFACIISHTSICTPTTQIPRRWLKLQKRSKQQQMIWTGHQKAIGFMPKRKFRQYLEALVKSKLCYM